MKRFMFIVMAMVSMTVAMAQQRSHTVLRGETLESIAQKYNISVTDLKKLKPDAAEMFYVGMKLNIPNKTVSNQQQTSSSTNTSRTATTGTYTQAKSSYKPKYKSTSHDNTFETMVIAGLSMSSWTGSDVSNADMKTGFHAGLAGRYTFAPSLFAETGLTFTTKGYKVKSPETTMTTYNIDVPINIGYAISLGDNMNLCLKAGPYFTYALSGEMEVKMGSSSGNSQQGQQGGSEGPSGGPSGGPDGSGNGPSGGPSGQEGNSAGGQQGGQSSGSSSTKTKLKDMKNYNTFNVGVDVGVSLEMGHFLVAATYQHGLGALNVNKKQYEQNIFVSVGYKF